MTQNTITMNEKQKYEIKMVQLTMWENVIIVRWKVVMCDKNWERYERKKERYDNILTNALNWID